MLRRNRNISGDSNNSGGGGVISGSSGGSTLKKSETEPFYKHLDLHIIVSVRMRKKLCE